MGTFDKDLSRLLDNAYYDGFKIYYNGYQYQKLKDDVASCGAHVIMRILTFLNHNMKLKQYHKFFLFVRTKI